MLIDWMFSEDEEPVPPASSWSKVGAAITFVVLVFGVRGFS